MKLEELDIQKGVEGTIVSGTSRQLCDVVGAGRWVTEVWRVVSNDRRVGYRLSLLLDRGKKGRSRKITVSAGDVLALPRLAQIIAKTLLDDGWLPVELKDDLACMSHALDMVVGVEQEAD